MQSYTLFIVVIRVFFFIFLLLFEFLLSLTQLLLLFLFIRLFDFWAFSLIFLIAVLKLLKVIFYAEVGRDIFICAATVQVVEGHEDLSQIEILRGGVMGCVFDEQLQFRAFYLFGLLELNQLFDLVVELQDLLLALLVEG